MKITYPDYYNSIMNVSNSILKHYKANTYYDSIKELDLILDKNYKHVFLIILDGMGVNLLNNHLSKNDSLLKNMRKEITSVFPSTTVAATNAILSATPPYVNGYIGWVQYFKNENTNLVVFRNQDYYDETKTFDYNLRDKYLSYPNIFERIKKANPDVAVHELFPDFREDGYKSFEDQLDRCIQISKEKSQSFSYIYWTNPDLTEHIYGINSKETYTLMQSLNSAIDEFTKQVKNDSLIIITADHGLVDVEEIDIMKNLELMDCLIRKPSIETRACNFFVKESRLEEFVEVFNKNYYGKFLLLIKDELYQEHLLGTGKKHLLIDDFIGDYMAIAIDKYYFKLDNKYPFKAHHAGLTRGEMIVPLIVFEKK
jgi:predicted AlkP superfamily pyrophosphatase or phosphodiesterase